MVLDGVLDRDVNVHALRSPIRSTHRRIDGQEVYFLVNDSGRDWQGVVTVSATGAGERWNPAHPALAQANLGQRVSLNLEPYGAALLRYPSAQVPARRKPHDGALPNLSEVQPIPEMKPAKIQGEFVQAEVAPDPTHSQPGHPAWRVPRN